MRIIFNDGFNNTVKEIKDISIFIDDINSKYYYIIDGKKYQNCNCISGKDISSIKSEMNKTLKELCRKGYSDLGLIYEVNE